MKITCICGSFISDSTDYISYKARFVADQDIYDMKDAVKNEIKKFAETLTDCLLDKDQTNKIIEETINSVSSNISKYMMRNMYQCTDCGALFVDDEEYNAHAFEPYDDDAPRNLMRSVEGENWKRYLRGHWNSRPFGSPHKGNLSWGFGVEDEGFEYFDDFEELRQKYFEVFNRLKKNNILRDAYFSKDGETLHTWEQNDLTEEE